MTDRTTRAERSRDRMRARNVPPIAERAPASRAAVLENHLIQGGLAMQTFKPCAELAPPDCVPTCSRSAGCTHPDGHAGAHTTKAEPRCNRPGGHAGDHVIYTMEAKPLARWPQ